MPAVNGFLLDFMKMRKEVHTSSPGLSKTPSGTRVKHSKEPEPVNNSLAGIIEKKPHKKEVIEYLQERANHHTSLKMA